MYRVGKVMFIVTETPLHAGAGDSISGVVDLPIQREKHTNFPKIESSSLKGAIKEAVRRANKEVELKNERFRPLDNECGQDYLSLVLGPEDSDDAHASAIALTDARTLLFPVRSLRGVFAWITCPMVLEKFRKEFQMVNSIDSSDEQNNLLNDFLNIDFEKLVNTIPENSNVVIKKNDNNELMRVVVVEEYTFEVSENKDTGKVAQFLAESIFGSDVAYAYLKEKLKKDLVILSNDDFKDFCSTSTEVITRVKIDDVTGTVQKGALWTEEYLPQDTIMYSLVMASELMVDEETKEKLKLKGISIDEEAQNVMSFFVQAVPGVIQIGGNQTIGKGFVRLRFMK